MMFARHPEVPFRLVRWMATQTVLWGSTHHRVRPRMLEPDEFEPGLERGGWQYEASSQVEQQHTEEVLIGRLALLEAAWP